MLHEIVACDDIFRSYLTVCGYTFKVNRLTCSEKLKLSVCSEIKLSSTHMVKYPWSDFFKTFVFTVTKEGRVTVATVTLRNHTFTHNLKKIT